MGRSRSGAWLAGSLMGAAALACTPEPASGPPPAPDARTEPLVDPRVTDRSPVALTRDWPDGLEARVTLERRLVRGSTVLRGELTWRMRIRRSGPETILQSDRLSMTLDPAGLPTDRVNAATVLAGYLPSAAIDGAGALSLSSPAQARDQLRGAADVLPSADRDHRAFSLLAATWEDEEALRRGATAVWGSLLAPEGVPLGAEAVEHSSAAAGTILGREVPQRLFTRAEGRAPCFRGDAPARCALVRIRAEHDEASLAAAAEAAGVQSVRLELESTLLTEVATMLPHRVELVTRRRITAGLAGQVVTMEETETRTHSFRWDRRGLGR